MENTTTTNNVRTFKVDDWVVYKPYEGCSLNNISEPGKVIEVIGDGMYRVTFGFRSAYGTRTGKYCYSNLYPA